jgi:hypothetical protein
MMLLSKATVNPRRFRPGTGMERIVGWFPPLVSDHKPLRPGVSEEPSRWQ